MKQLHDWPKHLWLHIKEDYKLHICILVSFLIGGICAAVFAFTMSVFSCEELLLYLDDFFQNIHQKGADSVALFKASLFISFKNFGLLLLFSLMVIGAPFIAAFTAVRSFMHCFTLFFFFRLYGIRAALFFLAGMLPHYLLIVPCYWLLCVTCLKFSTSLLKERGNLKNKLSGYFVRLVALFLLAVLAALLQAYVEPLLIRFISGLFIN